MPPLLKYWQKTKHQSIYHILFAIGLVAFVFSTLINYSLLEYDGACTALRGVSFGDALSWATSARIKYLHGIWARPDIDEYHYVIVPIHSFLVWLSYKLHGLTLTGLRFPAFLMVTFVKMLICYLAYRELGKKYLIFALFFTAVYFPLNEQTRISNPESVQLGLMFISAVVLLFADNYRKKYLFLLSGILLGIAYFYKSTIFLLPLFPLAYFLSKRWLLKDKEVIFSPKADTIFVYAGFLLVVGIYVAFWIIPNLENLFWMYARGHYGTSYGLDMIIQRAKDPLLLRDEFARWYVEANFVWIASIVALLALVLMIGKERITKLDVIILAFTVVLSIQLSFTDLAWRRAFTLMPFGCWAFIRITSIVLSLKKDNLCRVNYVSCGLLIVSCYILLYYWITALGGEILMSYKIAFIVAFVIAAVGLFMKKNKPLWIAILFAILIGLHLPTSFKYSKNYFLQNSDFIKQGSIELGAAVGEAWVFGAYYYHLYNRANAFYVSTWTTLLMPDSFSAAREEHMTMPQFAKKYKLWTNTLGDLFRAVIINRYYPQYYQRWELPVNYREKYHSDVFIYPPLSAVTVSDRYLLVGAENDDVYITKSFYDEFIKPYANKTPILGPAVLTVNKIQDLPGEKHGVDTIHKVINWMPK